MCSGEFPCQGERPSASQSSAVEYVTTRRKTIVVLFLAMAAAAAFALFKARSDERSVATMSDEISALMRNLRAPGGGMKEVFALVERGDEAVPALIQALDDYEPRVRGLACWALGELKTRSREAIDALAARLNDDDPEVRASAINSLRLIKTVPTEVMIRLEVLRRTDEHPTVRNNAEEALLVINGTLAEPQRSVRDLLTDFGSPDQLQREFAINSISRIGLARPETVDDRVLEALTDRLLNDDYYQCRLSAALSISRFQRAPPFVIDALSTALGDEHFLVRSMSAQVLGNFGHRAAAALPRLRAFADDDGNAAFQKIAQETIDRISTADGG